MKFAIIAAGEGSRLATEGIAAPKPLVEVGGEKLIDRLIRIFTVIVAEEIVVICNEIRSEVKAHLDRLAAERNDAMRDGVSTCPISVVQKTTPSSMHSFFEISHLLADAPFVLTTVDTIFREKEFAAYVNAFANAVARGTADGMMGVTDFIDDESPLYVDTTADMVITAFLDRSDSCRFISGGIYGLSPCAIDTLHRCMERGDSRMRNFQRALVSDGLHLRAYPFSKVLDIDHASDIAKAEQFLQSRP